MKKLVEAMGGTISWTSAKGQGTTFRVTLLFAIDTACRIDRSDVGNVPDPLRGANVLLVEDNEMNMEIAECLLVDLGARVTRAWDGQEAVDIFAASSTGTFDIVFMDIMMPRKNGLEATRAIRALDRPDAKTVPICAMSANAFHETCRQALTLARTRTSRSPLMSPTCCRLSPSSWVFTDKPFYPSQERSRVGTMTLVHPMQRD